jgi:uridine phosphorylase
MSIPPILEFDPSREAIVNPHGPHLEGGVPRRAVLCFFTEVLRDLLAEGKIEEICSLRSELGLHPIYRYLAETPEGAQEVLVAHAGLGAPLSVGLMEDIIWLGARSFIICGSCGVLHPEIAAGYPVILTAAVRDEGTSYHYLPPAREAFPHPAGIAALEAAFQAAGLPYRLGKSWTTDAIYRETPARRAARMAEGCDVVEMEASAFFALSEFRGVVCGQVVYGGDLVIPEGWDARQFYQRYDDRHLLFRLSIDACLRLSP